MEIHYIELKKFKEDKDINELNDLEEWVTFLKECNEDYDAEIINKLSKRKEEIGVAVELMKELSASELEYQRYLAREKYLMDERSKKAYAAYKMKLVKEEAERAKEALALAKEEAARTKEEAARTKEEAAQIKEEAAQIKEEAERKIKEALKIKEEIAISFLDMLDDKTIALKTGLNIEEVEKLRELNK